MCLTIGKLEKWAQLKSYEVHWGVSLLWLFALHFLTFFQHLINILCGRGSRNNCNRENKYCMRMIVVSNVGNPKQQSDRRHDKCHGLLPSLLLCLPQTQTQDHPNIHSSNNNKNLCTYGPHG